MKIVIIGGVAAGPRAASRIRRLMPDARITLINDNEILSYSGCGLPYFVSSDIGDIKQLYTTPYNVVRDARYFEEIKGVEIMAPFRAERIEREKKLVYLNKIGTDVNLDIEYDKLVIATGGQPVKPDIPGIGDEAVRTFSKPEDAVHLRKLAEQGKLGNVCIVGSDYMACELSEAFVALWGIDTTVIEFESSVLPKTLDPEMAALVRAEMERNGVKVRCSSPVEEFVGAGDKIKVRADGDFIEFDQVVVAAGIKANSDLARDAGLRIGESGGIWVDSRLRTSDPDIYAGGDCVENHHILLNKGVHLPLGSIANMHGRLIASNIAGMDREFPGVVGTMAVKVFDLNAACTGINEKTAAGNGFDTGCVWGSFTDLVDYYPGWRNIFLKMVYDRGSRELLGLQAVGPGEVVRRVDLFSLLLHREAEIDDLFDLESAYAPPYGAPLDPLYVMGCIAQNQLDGGPEIVSPSVFLNGNPPSDTTIIDIRQDHERRDNPIELDGREVLEAPLTELRLKLDELNIPGRSVVICSRGIRGYEGAMILKEAGKGHPTFLGAGWSFYTSAR
jgi:NADPH-dependent 2,4-dienoyl-CoA reductase/sulfur reductase-like enzyme/rhodanese-related sulfurtransferase